MHLLHEGEEEATGVLEMRPHADTALEVVAGPCWMGSGACGWRGRGGGGVADWNTGAGRMLLMDWWRSRAKIEGTFWTSYARGFSEQLVSWWPMGWGPDVGKGMRAAIPPEWPRGEGRGFSGGGREEIRVQPQRRKPAIAQ